MIKKLAVCAGFIMTISFAIAQTIVTESTSNSTVTSNGKNETTVKSPHISLSIGAVLC